MHQFKINQQITNRNSKSVIIYFQEVSRFPMITHEEETALATKIRHGDEIARQKLVEANLRFVISVAKQFQNQGLSLIDLINEGNLGLVKASGKFDETRGFKFISYAIWWIRQSIMQAISEQTRIVRLPLNRLSNMYKMSKAIRFLEQQYGREPTNNELAEYLEINIEQIETSKALKQGQISFDKPMSPDGESDFTLYDLVHSENSVSPDNNLIGESTSIDLIRAINKLNKRESEILTLSFGLNNNKVYSLGEISGLLDITNERVRQIRRSALYKLKSLLSGKTLFHDNI